MRTTSGRQTGSASLELVLAAPLVLVFVLFVIGLGRLTVASHDVVAAANDAARAASLTPSTASAASAGESAARAALGRRGMACAGVRVSIDVSERAPGGRVRARVACTARLGDVALAGFPGTKTYEAEAIVPVEQYREDR